MYVAIARAQSGLGFSLKPPKWARDIYNAVTKKIPLTVTVPTPAGPVMIDSRDPDAMKKLQEQLRQTHVAFGPQPDSPVDQVRNAVESHVPGGWMTIAGVGVALFVLPKLFGGGRH